MLKQPILVLVSTLLVIVMSLPIAKAQDTPLPVPTGPYQVGVTSLTLIDETREEIFTKEPGDKRAVTVWVWYPADVPEGAEPSPYLMEGFDVEHSAFAGVEVLSYGGDPVATQEWLSGLHRDAYAKCLFLPARRPIRWSCTPPFLLSAKACSSRRWRVTDTLW